MEDSEMTSLRASDAQLQALAILRDRPHLLWANVARKGADDCWPWTASVNADGYASVRVGSTGVLAHRAVFYFHNGALPHSVCHRCDVPRCCNPAHLFASDHAGNMADMRDKGRRRGITAGERNGRARLTSSTADHIKTERAHGALMRDLAAKYGVGLSTISRVCRGENWK
jgi:hypothetical protein